MPLYEYQCDACAHRFEVIQKFSDALVTICPKCAGTVRKLVSSPAIQFKGSGWYITDYARAGKSETASSTKSEGTSSSEAKIESKGETKTETTAESKSESKSESQSQSKSEKSDPKPSSATS